MSSSQLLSEEGYRLDGRRQSRARELNGEMGVFKQADGSAYFEMGHTKVLAAVYGPHEIRVGKGVRSNHERATINCQYSMAVFSTSERKMRPRGDRKSTEITLNIKNTFEAAILTNLYPRSKIDIFIEVLQADGGNLAASINAATLALIDAGVSMKGLMVACSIGMWDNHLLTDTTHTEENIASSKITLATIPTTGHIAMLNKNGQLFMSDLDRSIEAAEEGCAAVLEALVDTIRQQQIDVTE